MRSQVLRNTSQGRAPGSHCITSIEATPWREQDAIDENLRARAAIAQTLDAASNLRAQDRMRTLTAQSQLIVPGHDPAVFERFPRVADGVVRIAGPRAAP